MCIVGVWGGYTGNHKGSLETFRASGGLDAQSNQQEMTPNEFSDYTNSQQQQPKQDPSYITDYVDSSGGVPQDQYEGGGDVQDEPNNNNNTFVSV